jgi:transposase
LATDHRDPLAFRVMFPELCWSKDAENDQVHVIRHKVLLEGKSVRLVAKEMSVSRNTVAKYLKHPEPKRKAARKRAPVTEMVAPRIEEILSEWRGRTIPSSE